MRRLLDITIKILQFNFAFIPQILCPGAAASPPTSYALFILLLQIVCCHFAFVPPGCAETFNFVQHDDEGKKSSRSAVENENIA